MRGKRLCLFCLLSVLIQADTGLALVIDDFEAETLHPAWTANVWLFPPTNISLDTVGATSGNQSLRIEVPNSGWINAAMVRFHSTTDPCLYDDYTETFLGMFLISPRIEMDVTIDPNDWVAEPEADASVQMSCTLSTQVTGPVNLPVAPAEGVDPNEATLWRLNDLTSPQTRRIGWDLTEMHAALVEGAGDWFQLLIYLEPSGFPDGGVIHIDHVRLITDKTASNPNPADRATEVPIAATLRWSAGAKAVSHNVYIGTDANAVTAAVAGSDPAFQFASVETPSFYPGPLEFATTYYWRVDEVNDAEPNSPWIGPMWQFTTGQFVVIDDFEDYNDEDNLIFTAWLDGYVNGTGSMVGYFSPPYAEQDIVHTGEQSMPFVYDNLTIPHYSEIQRPWGDPQDWDALRAETLTVWVYGDMSNPVEPLHIGVSDSAGATASTTHGDLDVVRIMEWQRWDTPLRTFSNAGVDLTAITSVYLAVGYQPATAKGSGGILYIDDVRLHLAESTE